MLEEPSVALCDSYLEWFPAGPSVLEIEDIRFQEQAWDAFEDLGRTPDEVDLVSFARKYPGTDAENEAYRRVAQMRVQAADDELAKGPGRAPSSAPSASPAATPSTGP